MCISQLALNLVRQKIKSGKLQYNGLFCSRLREVAYTHSDWFCVVCLSGSDGVVSSSGLKPKYLWFAHVADTGCTLLLPSSFTQSISSCTTDIFLYFTAMHGNTCTIPSLWPHPLHSNYSTAPPTAPTAALLWLPVQGKFLFPITIEYQASAQSPLSKSAIYI